METRFEYILTNSYKADLIAHIHKHPRDFPELLRLAISDKQPYSQKAAWLLWSCMEENDSRVKGFIKKIIQELPKKIERQQRELLIVLGKMNIENRYVAELFDRCTVIWQKVDKKPSIRYAAFRLMAKIAQKHPGLIHELQVLTSQIYIESLSKIAQKSIMRGMQKLLGSSL